MFSGGNSMFGHVMIQILLLLLSTLYATPQKMIIISPLADLRASPHPAPAGIQGPALSKDLEGDGEGQISQLLFGEPFLAEPAKGHPGWLSITCREQTLQDNKPLKGYIEKQFAMPVNKFLTANIVVTKPETMIHMKNHKIPFPVPFGAKLHGKKNLNPHLWTVFFGNGLTGTIKDSHVKQLKTMNKKSENELRENIISTAEKFIGTPYVWGGSSMLEHHIKNQLIGIDCSNLIRIIHSVHGISTPRNSSSQFKAAKSVATGNDLQPGDLVFLTSTKSKNIVHVMLYTGDGMLIEASGNPASLNHTSTKRYTPEELENLYVRTVSIYDYLGLWVDDIYNGMVIKNGKRKGTTVYLGSMFNRNK